MRPSAEQRFWEKVNITPGCWYWNAYVNALGYGQFFMDKHHVLAHRASWIFSYGEIPEGMVICHQCDNPPCVNPSHLFLGTMADNMRDKWAKNRANLSSRPGELGGNAKLTNAQASEIRNLYKSGAFTHKSLSERYGVSESTIGATIRQTHFRQEGEE